MNAHRKRRGEAAIAIAVVLWVIAGIVIFVGQRSAKGSTGTTTAAGESAAAPASPASSETP